jgi:hypothetical protein
MAEKDYDGPDVDQFLRDHIDTVPHLEALLLLWNCRPKEWSVEEMAKGLFLPPEVAKEILEDLLRQHLTVHISGSHEAFRYEPQPDQDELIAAVDSTYRKELIRISRLIHSKPSAAVREFARAFRIKKDRE